MNKKNQIRNDLRSLLLEKEGDTYDYGCAMVKLKISDNQWKKVQDLIKDEDIYTEEGDQTYGRENEPHITILFGLHATISDKDIEETFSNLTPLNEVVLKKISIFESEKYDVVKFDIIGEDKKALAKMNKEFSNYPHTTSYPDYHPHCTIAYVKSGKGKDYVKTLSNEEEIVVKTDGYKYSKADGTKKLFK